MGFRYIQLTTGLQPHRNLALSLCHHSCSLEDKARKVKRMKLFKNLVLATTLASLPFVASAGVITTTFSSNNGFAGNMFDTTIASNDLTVTGIDVNLGSSGATTEISVWTRLGSYMGFESDASAWTLQSVNSVTSAGTDEETFVDVSDFALQANSLYGFYVLVTGNNSVSMNYTNGSNTYTNADLSLSAGIGRGNGAFTGGIFNPRTWNGSIHYNEGAASVPEPATFGLLSIALLGLGLRRRRQRA